MHLTTQEICQQLHVPCTANLKFNSISTDSRTLQPGALFVAIIGQNFDGHDYIDAAIRSGATAVLVSKPCNVNVPVITVENTLHAYGQIAKLHRSKFNLPIAAVTGSCGKTTVQGMLASILRQVANTLSPAGSFNNEIGVPRTLLELSAEHAYAVLEMGARKPGDIKYLMDIVNPQVTLVNNVAPAHTETFGSVEAIATTKGEIYKCLGPTGVAVINVDDAFAPYWLSSLSTQKIITIGLEHAADITCSYIVEEHHRSKMELVTDIGSITVELPLLGMHNVKNALAATAMARGLNIPLDKIKAGLEAFSAVTRRMEVKEGLNGAKIIDDSYNANPLAMSYAVDVLSKQAGTKVMVIGDMLELGAISEETHRALGQQAKAAGIDHLFAYGDFSKIAVATFGSNARFYADKNQLINDLKPLLNADMVVLVKGSNGMRMNDVVNALL